MGEFLKFGSKGRGEKDHKGGKKDPRQNVSKLNTRTVVQT